MKVFIKTYGCSLNQADSEVMAGLIDHSAEHSIVNNPKDADLIIINSCTVKNQAEKKFWMDVKKIKKPKILAGCVPQADKSARLEKYPVLGVSHITDVVDIIDEFEKGRIHHWLDDKKIPRHNIPKLRRNRIIEKVPIAVGCLGSCTYCKVKHARGHLYSYDENDIITHVQTAVKDGAKEIWITSQDCGCYGLDINTNIVHLLSRILKLDGDFFVRLGMANPNHILLFITELIEIYKHPRMFKFLHVPVQAGNNRILKLMNRRYTAEQFISIIESFSAISDLTLATDIICGFPTETQDEFIESINLIKKIRPDVLNISRYWPRPDTEAAGMMLVPGWETKKRSQEMNHVFNQIALENNKKWMGWEGPVLVDEKGKNNTWIARNSSYKQVILSGDHRIGDLANVRIKSATQHDLRC